MKPESMEDFLEMLTGRPRQCSAEEITDGLLPQHQVTKIRTTLAELAEPREQLNPDDIVIQREFSCANVSHRWPTKAIPGVFVRYLDTPIMEHKGEGTGSPVSFVDCIVAVWLDNEIEFFAFDSRRLQRIDA